MPVNTFLSLVLRQAMSSFYFELSSFLWLLNCCVVVGRRLWSFFKARGAPHIQHRSCVNSIDAFTNQLIISHRLEESIETTLYRYYWSPAGLSVVFKLTVVKTHSLYILVNQKRNKLFGTGSGQAERAPFQGDEAPVVVVVEGEGGARMALQVLPHYSLGGSALWRPSNPDPVYSKTKK